MDMRWWGKVCLAGSLVSGSFAHGAEPGDFVGSWSGSLSFGKRSLKFVFHVAEASPGPLSASLDSLDEKLFGIEVTKIGIGDDGTLTLEMDGVKGTYEAKLSEGGTELDGHWKQRGQSLELDCKKAPLERVEKLPGQESWLGNYQGALDVSGQSLRIALRLREAENGRLVATLDSLDQGVMGLPAGMVSSSGRDEIEIPVAVIGASFHGKRAAGKVVGTWKQGPSELPLEFSPVATASRLNRPQTPQPPFPYREVAVAFDVPGQDVRIAGTLTLPSENAKAPYAAALLISGSGPQDRDETLFEHKPFKVIADALTRSGVAVLRVDDRGTGESTGRFEVATSADFALDVEAGIEFLKRRAEIDPKRIGLIGHSEGGLIAPMVAARREDVAYAVLLAGPAVNGEAILLEQSALIARAGGATEEAVVANRSAQEKAFAIVKDRSIAPDEAARRMKEVLMQQLTALRDDGLRKQYMSQVDAQVDRVNAPWMRYFITYEPGPALEALRIPVLALFGDKDLQVPPKQSVPRMVELLAKNERGIVEVMPGVNHLFQPCETGAVEEYAKIEQTLDRAVLLRIVDFVTKTTASQSH